MDKLSGENTRWSKQVQEIKVNNKLLPIRTLIASAFNNYLSDKDENDREKALKDWV